MVYPRSMRPLLAAALGFLVLLTPVAMADDGVSDPEPAKPFVKKVAKLKSNSLQVRVGCGRSDACSLEISGRLRGRSKGTLEPVYLDLGAGERRTVQLLGGSDNADVRRELKKYVKARQKVKLLIDVRDMETGGTSRMAINEKPPCCPWPKKNKANN